jgi:capsid protein
MKLPGIFRRIIGQNEPARRPAVQPLPTRPVNARYDAAQNTTEMQNYWAAADALDADACNSYAVRRTLRNRSRYQIANDGDARGIVSTNTNYNIGTGPTLRMQTGSPGMNAMVEAAWQRWCNAAKFNKKLRTLHKAKCGDGEAFAQIIHNPLIADVVQLDLAPIECDRVTDPMGMMATPRYIDGIQFDEFGNPISYDVLRIHPGSNTAWPTAQKNIYDTIPAQFMVHWFREDRPGQHRAVPEMSSSLNLFGMDRRYSEAVLTAAETAADISAVMEQQWVNNDDDVTAPFSSIPIEKRMLIATPPGAKLSQFKAEQPTANYIDLKQENSRGKARPLNMPNNIARADSSGYSFSGGKLDHKTFFVSIDIERQDAESDVLDPIFAAWFIEARKQYGWTFDAAPPPKHSWDWPGKPVIDETKAADANGTNLSNGCTTLSRVYAEAGLDFEDEIQLMASDYGVTPEAIRQKLFEKMLGPPNPIAAPPAKKTDPAADNPPARANGNGHNRISAVLGGLYE